MNIRSVTAASLVIVGITGIIVTVVIVAIRRGTSRPVNDGEIRHRDRLAAAAIGVALLVSVLLETIGVALVASSR